MLRVAYLPAVMPAFSGGTEAIASVAAGASGTMVSMVGEVW